MRKLLPIMLAALYPAFAQADGVVARWEQFAPDGTVEVRAITTAPKCPLYGTGDKILPMTLRASPDVNFPVRLCSAQFRPGSSADGAPMPQIAAMPKRIMVFGDTGCRIKGTAVQACNDPKAWPFAAIAAEAAALKPDLVIHVGDYLYRESPCPDGNAGCAGSPYGDNWASWSADFFTPAAPLLAAAPWVIVRGNHEDCARGGPGWLRLLGPVAYDPAAPCTEHVAPYAVSIGAANLVVMDNASAPDTSIDHDLLAGYKSDFAALPELAKPPVWLAMHRPIWGAITGPAGVPVGGNATLIAALGDGQAVNAASLMLAGHIHTFEAMNYAKVTPPGIVAGFGGDNLDVTPVDLSGANLSGTYVKDGMSLPGFGFLMMEQEGGGWRIDVHRVDGTIEDVCHFANGRVDCGAVAKAQ
jgi:calcineurin-like phosphoesterase family protein